MAQYMNTNGSLHYLLSASVKLSDRVMLLNAVVDKP